MSKRLVSVLSATILLCLAPVHKSLAGEGNSVAGVEWNNRSKSRILVKLVKLAGRDKVYETVEAGKTYGVYFISEGRYKTQIRYETGGKGYLYRESNEFNVAGRTDGQASVKLVLDEKSANGKPLKDIAEKDFLGQPDTRDLKVASEGKDMEVGGWSFFSVYGFGITLENGGGIGVQRPKLEKALKESSFVVIRLFQKMQGKKLQIRTVEAVAEDGKTYAPRAFDTDTSFPIDAVQVSGRTWMGPALMSDMTLGESPKEGASIGIDFVFEIPDAAKTLSIRYPGERQADENPREAYTPLSVMHLLNKDEGFVLPEFQERVSRLQQTVETQGRAETIVFPGLFSYSMDAVKEKLGKEDRFTEEAVPGLESGVTRQAIKGYYLWYGRVGLMFLIVADGEGKPTTALSGLQYIPGKGRPQRRPRPAERTR